MDASTFGLPVAEDPRVSTLRSIDQSRQLRNSDLVEVIVVAAQRIGRVAMSDGRRMSDVVAVPKIVIVAAVDMISEAMVTGDGVSRDELCEIVVASVRVQAPDMPDVDAVSVADAFLRELSNDAENGRAFEFPRWDAEAGRPYKVSCRLVEFVTIEGEGRWRLTDDGMYLALVALDGGSGMSEGDVLELAINKAITRGRWSEVRREATRAYQYGRNLMVGIRNRIQQARASLSYDWEGLHAILMETRSLVSERRKGTGDVIARLDEAASSPNLTEEAAAELRDARGELVLAEARYSTLAGMLVDTPAEFAGLCLIRAGRRIAPTIMPDLREEVLRPFLRAPVAEVDAFLDVVSGTLFPLAHDKVVDVHAIVSELAGELAEAMREAPPPPGPEEVFVAAPDDWGLEEAIRLEGILDGFMPRPGETAVLSELLARMAEALAAEEPTTRDAAYLGAILTEPTQFDVGHAGRTFDIPGVARGDDLLVTRIGQ